MHTGIAGTAAHWQACLTVITMFDPMTILWSAIGVTVVAVAGGRLWFRAHPPADSVLGTVSHQWLEGHRRNGPDRR